MLLRGHPHVIRGNVARIAAKVIREGDAMPAATADNQPDDGQTAEVDTEAPPLNPLEAIRRAQANRALPPGVQQHGGGKGAGGKGAKGKSPRMYNRHK
jgi:hypothetical protein